MNAPESGVIVEQYAQPEDNVEVGKDLLKIDENAQAPEDGGAKEEKKEEPKEEKEEPKAVSYTHLTLPTKA